MFPWSPACLQEGWGGLLVYGLLVFLVEFLPLGSINPKEVAEYFGAVSHAESMTGQPETLSDSTGKAAGAGRRVQAPWSQLDMQGVHAGDNHGAVMGRRDSLLLRCCWLT
jgi:hypothetical protein